MICPNCKTRNPIGNKFCRQCGAPLVLPEGSLAAEEAARVEAERQAEKVAELMAQSHVLADARKFDEAIPLAEEAAQILPNSTSAHSLLATLYERTEQEQKAIAAMETVVRLNPGSVADQIKLDQLKRGIHVLPRSVPVGSSPSRLQESAPLPWMPLALSGGVVVVVVGAGLWWLSRSQAARQQQTPQVISQPVAAPTAPPISAANPSGIAPVYVAPSPGATPIPRFSSQTVPGPPPPASQVRDDPFASTGAGPRPQQTVRATPAPARRTVPTTNSATSSATRPVAPVTIAPPPGVGSGTTSTNGLPPISTGPPQNNGGAETGDGSSTGGGQPASSGFGAGGRIPVGPPSQNSPGNGSPTNPDSNGQGASNRTGGNGSGDSYIHISVSGSSGSNSSGAKRGGRASASSGGAFTPSSPLARARALQQSGQYRQAISAYREASNGSSAGSAYQGMAQCYESLNDTGGAKSAYRDAIRAYTTQGSASAQRGINSCKAALEVLGGG